MACVIIIHVTSQAKKTGGFLFNANDLRDLYMREVVFLDYFELKKLKVTKNYCV